MSLVKKYRYYILAVIFVVTGYFIFSWGNNNEELADIFICPEEDLDVEFTLRYMAEIKDLEGTMKILDFLKERGCDIALQKLQARMTEDIQSGTSPGFQ